MKKENQLERDMRDRGRKGGQKKTWREGEKIANLRRKEMTEGKQKERTEKQEWQGAGDENRGKDKEEKSAGLSLRIQPLKRQRRRSDG